MHQPRNLNGPAVIKILHVGPDLSAHGGIASVQSGYASSADIFEKFGCRLSFQSTCAVAHTRDVWQFLLAWWRVVRDAFSGNIEIVHIHMSIRGSLVRKWLIAATCNVLRKKYVLHIHSGAMSSYLDSLPLLFRVAVQVIFKRATRLICLSNPMRCWLVQYSDGDQQKCQLLYNGVQPPALRHDHRRTTENPIILFLGKLSEAKGVTTLLDAAGMLKKSGMPFRLYVAGNGDVEGFKAAILQRDLLNEVSYVGWVEGTQKEQLLASADIFVLPSRSEGFPVSIVEAMAFGATVVATSIAGVMDAVTHEQEGLLVPPDDANALFEALGALINSPEHRTRLATAARQRFDEHFTLQRTAETLSVLYRELQ